MVSRIARRRAEVRGSFIYDGVMVRRAAVLVEFAMVLPLIMVIGFGMIELSRLMMLQHTADTAAYEGARHAMVPGATAEEAATAAQEMLDATGLRDTSIFVTPSEITESTPLITVRVDVPVGTNSWISFFRVGSYDVSSEVTMYCERPAVVRLSGRPKLKLKKDELLGAVPATTNAITGNSGNGNAKNGSAN
jgi:Flp pilus assembly protein TadG